MKIKFKDGYMVEILKKDCVGKSVEELKIEAAKALKALKNDLKDASFEKIFNKNYAFQTTYLSGYGKESNFDALNKEIKFFTRDLNADLDKADVYYNKYSKPQLEEHVAGYRKMLTLLQKAINSTNANDKLKEKYHKNLDILNKSVDELEEAYQLKETSVKTNKKAKDPDDQDGQSELDKPVKSKKKKEELEKEALKQLKSAKFSDKKSIEDESYEILEKQGRKLIILESVNISAFAGHPYEVILAKWEGSVQPYVIGVGWDPKTKNWGQGHYFSSLSAASTYFEKNYVEKKLKDSSRIKDVPYLKDPETSVRFQYTASNKFSRIETGAEYDDKEGMLIEYPGVIKDLEEDAALTRKELAEFNKSDLWTVIRRYNETAKLYEQVGLTKEADTIKEKTETLIKNWHLISKSRSE